MRGNDPVGPRTRRSEDEPRTPRPLSCLASDITSATGGRYIVGPAAGERGRLVTQRGCDWWTPARVHSVAGCRTPHSAITRGVVEGPRVSARQPEPGTQAGR